MKILRYAMLFVILLLALSINPGSAQQVTHGAQTQVTARNAFTYQGYLYEGGSPADGYYDFRVNLYNVEAGGSALATVVLLNNNVSGGYFTLLLEFGAYLDGSDLWLGLEVRPAGVGEYTLLTPRQPITSAPYATYTTFAYMAGNADTIDNQHGPFWSLGGNAGTDPSINYLGTSDDTALELKVNAVRVLRLEPDFNGPNVIGGYYENWVTDGAIGSTIFGGGYLVPNSITDSGGTVSGGALNQAGNNDADVVNAAYATVGGGGGNIASGQDSTISGGYYNAAIGESSSIGGGDANNASGVVSTISGGFLNTANGYISTISGGLENVADGDNSSIGGGASNTVTGQYSVIGGGYSNYAIGPRSVIGGGDSNIIEAGYSTIGGGLYNYTIGSGATIGGGGYNDAGGESSTVAGGNTNNAGSDYGFIGGGYSNYVTGQYSVIGGGNDNSVSGSTAVVGRGILTAASGNYSTVAGGSSNVASGTSSMIPGGYANTAAGNYSFAAGRQAKANNAGCFVWGDNGGDINCNNDNRWMARSSGGVYFYTNSSMTTGVFVAAGGGSWSSVSNPALKANLKTVDSQALVAKVAQMPISTWNYTSQDASIRHVGPMADDFNALMPGLGGEGEMYINSLDADGIALASIQGLYQIIQEKDNQISALEARVTALEASRGASKPVGSSMSNWLPGLFGLLGVAAGVVVSRKRGGSQ